MTTSETEWDIFISYAREDTEWVEKYLYDPLLRCHTADGRRPRIFFDVKKEGVKIGQIYTTALVYAISKSKKFVPVYSGIYFKKEMCQYELLQAHHLDPVGTLGKLNPILIDPMAADQVPVTVSLINYWVVTSPDWFERLCDALELKPIAEHTVLKFLDQPADTTINYTLPPLRVAVMGADGVVARDEQIRISVQDGSLEGTLTAKTENGIATFTDLSVSIAAAATSLIASAEGHDDVHSETFAVIKPVSRPPAVEISSEDRIEEREPRIALKGEAVFFQDGKALVVIMPDGVALYDVAGNSLLPAPGIVKLKSRLRLVRRAGPILALADWGGHIYLFNENSQHYSCACGDGSQGFVVPGDLAVVGDKVYAGFWNGMVYTVGLGQSPVAEFKHDSGVQALAVVGERFYVCGFDGNLCVYKNGRMVNSEMLDPGVRLLQPSDGRLVAAGESKLYQIEIDQLKVRSEDLQLSGVAAVLGDVALPVVLDARGKGVRFNTELVKFGFHVTAGAAPVSADDGGRYCVFVNPDGTRTLMVDGRIVFSHSGGTLSMSPAADLFALGDENGIRVLDASSFESLIKGGKTGG